MDLTCKEMEERIEAVAAGDEPASEAFRAHVEACVRCAAALAQARRLEQALASRTVAAAPPRFAALVASRIRREHWRSEQQVDWFFNLAVAAGLIAIAGGVLALVNLGSVTAAVAAGVSAVAAFASQPSARTATQQAAPALSTYLLGGGFLVTALLVWSWAERRN